MLWAHWPDFDPIGILKIYSLFRNAFQITAEPGNKKSIFAIFDGFNDSFQYIHNEKMGKNCQKKVEEVPKNVIWIFRNDIRRVQF